MIKTATLTTLALATATFGQVLPFTETFDTDASNWTDGANAAFLDHFTDGGPNGTGDAYASSTLNFITQGDDATPVTHRGRGSNGASGNAFSGNYIASGIDTFSFDFRHNHDTPIAPFVRFATDGNFPGGTAVSFQPALPNTWTTVTIALDPNNPQFISFEGFTFEDIFTNVGRIQIGVDVPADLAFADETVRFDIDNLSIVPAPGAMTTLALGLGLAARRRRA